MRIINEVNIFSYGDSSKLSSWSNVPYFFTETMIKMGIKVNRIDISPLPFAEKTYNKTILKILKLLNTNISYEYHRTFFHYILTNSKIKKTLKLFPNSNANIFLTFSFSSFKFSNKPSILFGDWTYEYLINHFQNRKAGLLEKRSIKREKINIEKSSLLLPLFPGITKIMKQEFKNKEIYYLGNVINSLYTPIEKEVLARKSGSLNLLFIGSVNYLDGAKCLLESFINLKKTYSYLKLHIIGLTEKDLGFLPDDAHCHGYLDKGIDSSKQRYYELLMDAKILINTSPKWGAFSSTIEAMYFYTPVIVSPYEEFLETFGSDILFGKYCESNTPIILSNRIKEVLDNNEYLNMCVEAHKLVKGFTWNHYIEKAIEKMQPLISKNDKSV